MAKNFLLLKLILTMGLFISFSTWAKMELTGDFDKDKKILQTTIGPMLPSFWKMEISKINYSPFQWRSENTNGLKIRFVNTRTKKKILPPYSDKMINVNPQMVRYLFKNLEGGYSYSMIERKHPDQLEAILKNYVIIKPSLVSRDADNNVAEKIQTLWTEKFNIPPLKKHRYHGEVEEVGMLEDLPKLKKRFAGKKAVFFRSKKSNNVQSEFKIRTLN